MIFDSWIITIAVYIVCIWVILFAGLHILAFVVELIDNGSTDASTLEWPRH